MHVSAVCGRQVPIEVLLQCGNPHEQASHTGSIQLASRQVVDDGWPEHLHQAAHIQQVGWLHVIG